LPDDEIDRLLSQAELRLEAARHLLKEGFYDDAVSRPPPAEGRPGQTDGSMKISAFARRGGAQNPGRRAKGLRLSKAPFIGCQLCERIVIS